ncbi:2-dehydro-3-deoxyglucarate aldolase [Halomicrobium zhouii]|uniref:2-dehydro-3-deoxyglucarate aldolase n=1 Tax=Halomicrobium zhouii TaxID=767519 RepID=A0A1I6K2G9_9EURY|nr:aldolase/citrate lyase family protein [Halomicrobium zhouii]SFR85010.1 2-dehydro-3-deoxyglucarate aldolase [Halomicrobium zhouii]
MVNAHRTNGLRETVESGDVALGVLDSAYSPNLVELYGDLGMDFVWIDLEHGGPSPRDGDALENLLRAAEGTGTELLVRVPAASPSMVRKCLDVGVRNLFISQVEDVEDVERAISAAHFEVGDEPGRRGMANPRASRWGQAEDYAATEDEAVMVGVTIENQAAMDDLDAILDVPELGFVFLGPLDLSVALGHPGEADHPEVEEAVETARSKAVDAGVPVGNLAFGMDDANEKAQNGYQILNVGSTTGAVKAAAQGWLDDADV